MLTPLGGGRGLGPLGVGRRRAAAVQYLLDTVAGAVAAYSLRQLRAAATLCLRVRRSSDSAEDDFGFVAGVLDTAALLAFCGAASGFATRWYDQQTGGHDLLQATTTRQFRIVNAGVLDVDSGGRPMLLADGGDWMANSTLGATAQPTGLWLAFRHVGNAIPLDSRDLTHRQFLRYDSQWKYSAGSERFTGATASAARTLIGGVMNGASSSFRRDGAQIHTDNAGANSYAGVTVGANAVSSGGIVPNGTEMYEALIWSAPGANVAAIEADVNGYWGLY